VKIEGESLGNWKHYQLVDLTRWALLQEILRFLATLSVRRLFLVWSCVPAFAGMGDHDLRAF